MVLTLALSKGWKLHQLNINRAFLNGQLSKEVYMPQLPSLEDLRCSGYMCKLHKAIYGLKQAPRAWFDTLSQALYFM